MSKLPSLPQYFKYKDINLKADHYKDEYLEEVFQLFQEGKKDSAGLYLALADPRRGGARTPPPPHSWSIFFFHFRAVLGKIGQNNRSGKSWISHYFGQSWMRCGYKASMSGV